MADQEPWCRWKRIGGEAKSGCWQLSGNLVIAWRAKVSQGPGVSSLGAVEKNLRLLEHNLNLGRHSFLRAFQDLQCLFSLC
jgi:hypothetical protein